MCGAALHLDSVVGSVPSPQKISWGNAIRKFLDPNTIISLLLSYLLSQAILSGIARRSLLICSTSVMCQNPTVGATSRWIPWTDRDDVSQLDTSNA